LAGEHTADGLYNTQNSGHHKAHVGHSWRDNAQGNDYVAVLQLDFPLVPQAVSVHSLLPGNQFMLRGLTLIDNETGNGRNITIDPDYNLVHSGDVKIYENHAVLPRAYIVHHAIVVDDDEAALRTMQDPVFESANSVVLTSGRALSAGQRPSEVAIKSYEPQRIELQASLNTPGYLVLTDTYFPGWTAEVNGLPTTIHRANLYFRAVALGPGEHDVIFTYQPQRTRLAPVVGSLAWLAWVSILAIMVYHIGRKSPSGV
jgi:hypothetical protein